MSDSIFMFDDKKLMIRSKAIDENREGFTPCECSKLWIFSQQMIDKKKRPKYEANEWLTDFNEKI